MYKFSDIDELLEKTVIKFANNDIQNIVKNLTIPEIVRYDWDKIAFGFSVDDVITIPIDKIKIKYKTDYDNAKSNISLSKYFDNKKFEELPLIEVSFEKNNFYIEDGHHRFQYAKNLKLKEIPVKIIDIKDNPITALGYNSIDDIINFKHAVEEYKGQHQAPDNEGGSPLYDVTLNGTYPEDIYSSNGARYYGDGIETDYQAISIIQYYHNKPNASVKIYRAVPNITFDINKKLTEIQKVLQYYRDNNFFPMKNQIIHDLQDKYPIEQHEYDEQQKLILEDLQQQRNELFNEKENKGKLPLNSGDWVTTVRNYAKEHGQRYLNNQYKIVSKSVPASTLWTDGNSIHEWGYVE